MTTSLWLTIEALNWQSLCILDRVSVHKLASVVGLIALLLQPIWQMASIEPLGTVNSKTSVRGGHICDVMIMSVLRCEEGLIERGLARSES